MTVTREDLQNLNSEYSFLIETNLKDKDQDSILRLGFWAKDNQDKIRQVLEDRLNKPVIPDNSATEYMKAVDDSLIYGQSLVHTDKEGNIKHVPIKDIYQPDYKAIAEEMAIILEQGLKFRPTNKVEEYGIDCQLCINQALAKYKEIV